MKLNELVLTSKELINYFVGLIKSDLVSDIARGPPFGNAFRRLPLKSGVMLVMNALYLPTPRAKKLPPHLSYFIIG